MRHFDTDYTSVPMCPYCGHQRSKFNDPDETEPEVEIMTECSACGKDYIYEGEIDVTYNSYTMEEQAESERRQKEAFDEGLKALNEAIKEKKQQEEWNRRVREGE